MNKKILYMMFFIVMMGIFITLYLVVNFNIQNKKNIEIKAFNAQYEEYNKDNLNGLDITTIINKAVSNNDSFYIQKDSNGLYVDDDNRIEIYVSFKKKSYQMEKILKVGIDSFIQYFGAVSFNCTDVKYHENGKIASMTFEAKDY